jgi:hypothetical protein
MDTKTTKMFEEALRLVSEMPDTHRVFITGAHTHWLDQLRRDFRAAGLVGVEVITPGQILRGYLRGRRGKLLIDDIEEMSLDDRLLLLSEQEILELIG